MKDYILQQMEVIVNETMTSFQTDFFNYDKPRIASDEFQFPAIWIVGRSHTHLLELGGYKDRFFEAEAVRYDYVRHLNPYDYYVSARYYAKDRWFLIAEDGLRSISPKEAETTIINHVLSVIEAWSQKYGPLPKPTKVPVKLKGITLSELKALIAECRAHGNDSLLNCLKRRHQTCRVAEDQYTVVTYHKRWNEFIFCEYINGEEGLAGHIVFHGWPETGYQTNGAVELDPQYGWNSHT